MSGVSEVSAEGSVIAGRSSVGSDERIRGYLERRKSMEETGGI